MLERKVTRLRVRASKTDKMSKGRRVRMNKHAPPDNRLTVETNMSWEVRDRKEKWKLISKIEVKMCQMIASSLHEASMHFCDKMVTEKGKLVPFH